MAERMGFEPMKEFPLYTLSKRALSTTQPSLQYIKYITHYLLKNILKYFRFKDRSDNSLFKLIFYKKFIISRYS